MFRTFQITVSITHSCDALVMQLISHGLYIRGVELVEVIHHAVLPSVDLVDKFRFKTGENLIQSRRTLRSAVDPPAKRKRSNINAALHCEDEIQDFPKEDVDIVWNPSARWTTVSST
mmetsp:Transcript_14821/g.20314  ORF Transcript_14821/g.20314 Transcript_14821/m.20314 type:complete len:117 (+) Transcript_14821:643-993(+)